MDLEKFAAGIGKTGFLLEARAVDAFRAAGWGVISNKYYLDEDQELVREIDLVAYKASKVDSFRVYTCILISCKKSEKNVWAFLSRERLTTDPNVDWQPVHTWSNVPGLTHVTSQSDWRERYFSSALKTDASALLETPPTHVFAFQELDRKSGAPQNDSPIFQSVTSLMKAQAYELGSLPARKTQGKFVYQFNLLTVAETDLILLRTTLAGVEPSTVDSVHYLSSYIIKRRDTTARTYIVRASRLDETIRAYDALHAHNVEHFSEELASFFDGILSDQVRRAVLEPAALAELARWLRTHVQVALHREAHFETVSLAWDAQKSVAVIEIDTSSETIALLNDSAGAQKHVASVLRRVFRYEGGFEFRDDVPF